MKHERAQGKQEAPKALTAPKAVPSEDDILAKQEAIEAALLKNRPLALVFSLTSILITAILLLGILIDVFLAAMKRSGKEINIATYRAGTAKWDGWDVVKVVILFLFFGYVLVIIESFLAGIFPLVKNDNFRMVVNSSILDTLAIVFILYFTVGRYKEKAEALGISIKNFFKNVFYGMVGYVAAVPALVLVLIVTALIIQVTKYVPEKQPIVELFMKEDNAPFLIYTSIFTMIIGPILEELFFRGFMYNAFKKAIGVFWAMLFTSAVFAALHSNMAGFFPILVLGLLLAYLYEKTGTIISSVTVHIMHNLTMVFFVFLMKLVKV
ncbi:MAG: type II CAAX endopeptidase family protein [Candidatus Omnitrophota bacterium]